MSTSRRPSIGDSVYGLNQEDLIVEYGTIKSVIHLSDLDEYTYQIWLSTDDHEIFHYLHSILDWYEFAGLWIVDFESVKDKFDE
ncbi:hypothetical protein Xoosp13_352 [Xanthomonas phage Xoo-sp13]|nr:hypothetical protein Xoosp13_352 [Xanthomonas phage Xoo-sp13]